MAETLISLRQLSRRSETLRPLVDVSIDLHTGEVVGIAERTNHGTAELVSLLSGQYAPDAGEILIQGDLLQWPFQSLKVGLSILYREPQLVSRLDVASNIFLGREVGWPQSVKWLKIRRKRQMYTKAAQILQELDAANIPLHIEAGKLPAESQYLVSIAQVMAELTPIIIVDQPSAILSLPYQDKMLSLIRKWQAEGCAVLLLSSNLDHLFAVSDRIIVLRDGHVTANVVTDDTNREQIVAAMIGTSERAQRTPVIWAIDSYYEARKQAEMLRHQQKSLKQNLAKQDTLNRDLLKQLSKQVHALDSANLALQDAQRRLLGEREQERKYLARELHDQLIQDLLSLAYQLEEIEDSIVENEQLESSIADVRGNIRGLVTNVRQICGMLRPPTIDRLGLASALQSYLKQWSKRTGIRVNLTIDKTLGRLPEEIEISIFRIIQEGVTNVWKHANASEVTVSLKNTSPRTLLITVTDNGTGLSTDFDFSEMSTQGHFGLLGISERVALMGGKLNFSNYTNGGARLQIEIPHPRSV